VSPSLAIAEDPEWATRPPIMVIAIGLRIVLKFEGKTTDIDGVSYVKLFLNVPTITPDVKTVLKSTPAG